MKLSRFKAAGYAIGLILGLGLILAYGTMEMSSTPTFCGSCHVMTPYFESWQQSTHSDIACVECHIPPGIAAEFRKKYEAVAMVARYFTGTYGTNPWTEVEDAACLECHERRLLVGKELFHDVLFDHGPHLTEMRRGKRLRCTSCHSQIVQGSHIAVTSSTCILCHFKDATPGEGTARCTLCHETPNYVVDTQGVQFDHSDVSRFGMDCQACHAPSEGSGGTVPRERCVTCHNVPARLEEYDNGELLHRTHVSEHKIECTNCHLEIEHVAPRELDVVRSECETCHGSRHSPQLDLYAGIGGKGVSPSPDFMFRAGVRCEGCHLEDERSPDSTRIADAVSCMSCHGPGYRKLYEGWTATLETRTKAIGRQLDETAPRLTAASTAFADARANYDLVAGGRGIHNVTYSLDLLDAAHFQLNEAREEAGLGALPVPWPRAPYESDCLHCHAGAEAAKVRAFGREFDHRAHVIRGGVDCENCHTTHEERETSGLAPLKIGKADCNACHHGGAVAEGEEARECLDCHAGVRKHTIAVEEGDFSHANHVDDEGLECTDCHGEYPALRREPDRDFCSDCH